MDDVASTVSAYWKQHQLAGGDRPARLQAELGELAWAVDAVDDAIAGGDPHVLELLDALLASLDADPCALGAGSVEDLLHLHGRTFESALVERCRRSESWRRTLACVWLEPSAAQELDALRPFLRSSPRQ